MVLICPDNELKTELNNMDEKAVEDTFYRDLAFSTGGLRGTRAVFNTVGDI